MERHVITTKWKDASYANAIKRIIMNESGSLSLYVDHSNIILNEPNYASDYIAERISSFAIAQNPNLTASLEIINQSADILPVSSHDLIFYDGKKRVPAESVVEYYSLLDLEPACSVQISNIGVKKMNRNYGIVTEFKPPTVQFMTLPFSVDLVERAIATFVQRLGKLKMDISSDSSPNIRIEKGDIYKYTFLTETSTCIYAIRMKMDCENLSSGVDHPSNGYGVLQFSHPNPSAAITAAIDLILKDFKRDIKIESTK